MKKRYFSLLTDVAVGIFVLVIMALIGYGCWRLERWYNYRYSYKSFVTQQIEQRVAPLEKRIKALEDRQLRCGVANGAKPTITSSLVNGSDAKQSSISVK